MPDPQYTYRGAWANGEAYLVDDLVASGDVAYVCIAAHTSDAASAPPNGDYWDLLIEPSASTAYATVEEYRAFIGRQTLDDDAVIAGNLETASRWWDLTLQRPFGFGLVAAPVARTFYVHRAADGDGSRSLFVDEFGSTTGLSVSIDGEVVDPAEYAALPPNAAQRPEPWPFDELRRIGRAWPLATPIVVTARWGWPAVPRAIKEATIEWTAIWRGESPAATGRVSELDEVQSFSPYHLSQLKRLTSMYRRGRLPAIGARP